jgi:hypothetical protein
MRYRLLVGFLIGTSAALLVSSPKVFGIGAERGLPEAFLQQMAAARQLMEVSETTGEPSTLLDVLSMARELPEYPSDSNWLEMRKAKLMVLTKTLEAFMSVKIPKELEGYVPRINVAPPLESGHIAGVAPSAITDPKVRSAYEAALATNRQLLRLSNKYSKVAMGEKQCRDYIETFVRRNFDKGSVSEAKKMLQDAGISEKALASIRLPE